MRRSLLAALVLLTSAQAWAESEEFESQPLSAAPIEDKKAVNYKEVERGLYVGVTGGAQIYVTPPGEGGKLSLGQSAGFEIGYDPMPLLSIGAVVWGANANTPSTYYGANSSDQGNAVPHGNFSSLLLGANARVNFAVGKDANDVARSFVYVRAGAGYSLITPKGILPSEVVVFGGPGFEYYTHLRHFSVGVEADGTFGVGNKGFALLVQPLVRYSF